MLLLTSSCTLDDGVSEFLKCRLVDAEDVTSGRKEIAKLVVSSVSIATQTKLRIHSEDSSSSSDCKNTNEPLKLSKRALSVPDILKVSLTKKEVSVSECDSLVKPNKCLISPQKTLNTTMTKVVEELSQLFEKRKSLEQNSLAHNEVEEESIVFLPSTKSLTVPLGSPSGFSSDGTTVSLELSPDDGTEEIRRSIESLEEHIGPDYECTFDTDSSLCGVAKQQEKQFYADLTPSYFLKTHVKSSNSCESLLDDHVPSSVGSGSFESLLEEHDCHSLRTYTSSPNISTIGFSDELESIFSDGSSNEDTNNREEHLLDETHNKWERKRTNGPLVVRGSMSVDFSKPLPKRGVNKVILELSQKYRHIDSEVELDDVDLPSDSDSRTSSSVITVISRETFEERQRKNELKNAVHLHCTEQNITVEKVLPVFISNDDKILNKNLRFDENRNESLVPFTPSDDRTEDGYEADLDKTIYSPLSLSSINFDDSLVSPAGYEADLGEMSTSFSYFPDSLYTIYEDMSPEV